MIRISQRSSRDPLPCVFASESSTTAFIIALSHVFVCRLHGHPGAENAPLLHPGSGHEATPSTPISIRYHSSGVTGLVNTTTVCQLLTIEPLKPSFLTYGSPFTYPPDRSPTVLPSNIYFVWTEPLVDWFIADAMSLSAASLVEARIQDGQDLKNAVPYVNYALFGTPMEVMYGENLAGFV